MKLNLTFYESQGSRFYLFKLNLYNSKRQQLCTESIYKCNVTLTISAVLENCVNKSLRRVFIPNNVTLNLMENPLYYCVFHGDTCFCT